jgi:hypothetical protein
VERVLTIIIELNQLSAQVSKSYNYFDRTILV